MELPPRAESMYSTWWNLANETANTRNDDGSYSFNIAEFQQIASGVNQDVYAGQAPYDAPGLSQLFSYARQIGNATNAVAAADPASGIHDSMVAQAPWSPRTAAEQAASPEWQARVQMTYTDSNGIQLQEYTVVVIKQVLPSSVASLQAQLELRIQDQLSSPPGTGTPRNGTLDSVDSITLLAV